VAVMPVKRPRIKATNKVISVFIFVSSILNIDMLSFKQFLNYIEEQTTTVPVVPTKPTSTGTKPATTAPKIPDATRKKLDSAAVRNTAAIRLYQTGKTQQAVDALRKDPNFLLAMQDLTKTSAPATASQLVNVALGGNP